MFKGKYVSMFSKVAQKEGFTYRRKKKTKKEVNLKFKFIYELQFFAVIIPSGYEGRTGMACIRLKENCEFNGEGTYRHVNTHLPNYARPRFIRIKVNQCS